jgi:hypothetical protein
MLVRCTAKALSLVGRAEFSMDPVDDSKINSEPTATR